VIPKFRYSAGSQSGISLGRDIRYPVFSPEGYQNTGTVYPLTMGRPIADSVVNGPFNALSVADRLTDKIQNFY